MSLSAAANKISDNDFQNIGPAPRPPVQMVKAVLVTTKRNL